MTRKYSGSLSLLQEQKYKRTLCSLPTVTIKHEEMQLLELSHILKFCWLTFCNSYTSYKFSILLSLDKAMSQPSHTSPLAEFRLWPHHPSRAFPAVHNCCPMCDTKYECRGQWFLQLVHLKQQVKYQVSLLFFNILKTEEVCTDIIQLDRAGIR